MTNHPVAKYPTIDTFSKADANASYHYTFLRYKTLTNITSNHEGKFTRQDMIDTLKAVYAETNDQVLFKERALEVNMPERTTTDLGSDQVARLSSCKKCSPMQQHKIAMPFFQIYLKN
jgi:hypothetical protein